MTGKQPIQILVADDDLSFRQCVVSLIRQHADMEVVGEAANGAEAIALTRRLNPDLAILDISMPQLNGIQVTKAITGGDLKTRVIAFSLHKDSCFVEYMFQAGARGYVCKDDHPDELVAGIRAIMQGQHSWARTQSQRRKHDVETRYRSKPTREQRKENKHDSSSNDPGPRGSGEGREVSDLQAGAEEYGLEILKVQEIIKMMEITKVPRTPDFVRGVINLRGKVIPVVDLRLKFGMATQATTDKTCVIVVQVKRNDEQGHDGHDRGRGVRGAGRDGRADRAGPGVRLYRQYRLHPRHGQGRQESRHAAGCGQGVVGR